MNVTPLADRVIIRSAEELEKTAGGIYVPDSAKEKPQEGEIVAAGKGRVEDGKEIAMEVKVGDKVLYGKYSGQEIVVDGESLIILRESDILAIIK
jgi:chaperonin GroES